MPLDSGVVSRLGRAARTTLRSAARMLVAATFGATLAPTALAQGRGTAVEYYHAGFNHYFVTAFPGEIALLDGGAFGGAWARTGHAVPVWLQPQASTVETCRFFSETFTPRSSHFYTPYASECATLRQGTTWTYEGVAFHLRLADGSGNCPAGTSILYRLYNDSRSGAPNHRYTTNRAVFEQMRAAGWIPEGNGPQVVFACVPAGGGATDAIGLWEGTTGTGEDVVGVVLSDGSFYLFHGDGASRVNLVQGTGVFANRTFSSTSARDYEFIPAQDGSAATVTGTYVPRTSLSGTIASRGRTTTFSMNYTGDTPAPLALPSAPRTLNGVAYTLDGSTFGNITLGPGGRLAGDMLGCKVTGTLTPRTDIGVADLTVTISGSFCALGSDTMTGIALYEEEGGVGAMVMFARNAAQTNAIALVALMLPIAR